MVAVANVTYSKLTRVMEELVRQRVLTFAEYNAIVGSCELMNDLQLAAFKDGYGVDAHNDLAQLLKKESEDDTRATGQDNKAVGKRTRHNAKSLAGSNH